MRIGDNYYAAKPPISAPSVSKPQFSVNTKSKGKSSKNRSVRSDPAAKAVATRAPVGVAVEEGIEDGNVAHTTILFQNTFYYPVTSPVEPNKVMVMLNQKMGTTKGYDE